MKRTPGSFEGSFVVLDKNPQYGEILRVTEDGEVYMRTTPDFGTGRLVRVLLARHEVDRLRECAEPHEAIEALCGIIARLARPQ